PFCPGGADMFAYDVNADGLNDVITSLDAHGYGLVWWCWPRHRCWSRLGGARTAKWWRLACCEVFTEPT
ncbi:MAG: hypothetical protein ACKO8U_06070, partial [Pirellula sp.]